MLQSRHTSLKIKFAKKIPKDLNSKTVFPCADGLQKDSCLVKLFWALIVIFILFGGEEGVLMVNRRACFSGESNIRNVFYIR